MSTKETRARVAAHPEMVRLRLRLDAFRRRLNKDYGANFMGIEIRDQTDVEYEAEQGQEGINRWTPVERKYWYDMEREMKHLRRALLAHYSQGS